MEQIKKNRSINWSENDKKVLKMLIIERAEVLENKDTTTNTSQLKKHAWREVLSRFNALCPVKRDLLQLQTQWRNLKNRAKKSEFEYRRSQNRTGGGPPPPSPPLADKEIMEAIPLEFVIVSNVFDSDGFHNQETKVKENSEQGPELDKPAILPTHTQKKKAKKNEIHNKRCCPNDHEHKLFLLAKKAREQAMQYQKEEHEKKMCILALKEKFWKNKTSNI